MIDEDMITDEWRERNSKCYECGKIFDICDLDLVKNEWLCRNCEEGLK